MSRSVTTAVNLASEVLTPLVQGEDGRYTPVATDYRGQATGTGMGTGPGSAFPGGFPGGGGFEQGWMDRESILPGFKNSTVLIGGGVLAALALFLITKKNAQQVLL